jgi:hypothetical protein
VSALARALGGQERSNRRSISNGCGFAMVINVKSAFAA